MAHDVGDGSGGSAAGSDALARELARVGVDWAELVRALAPAPIAGYRDVVFAVDTAGVLAALRALPDGAGTAALVAAVRRGRQPGGHAT